MGLLVVVKSVDYVSCSSTVAVPKDNGGVTFFGNDCIAGEGVFDADGFPLRYVHREVDGVSD